MDAGEEYGCRGRIWMQGKNMDAREEYGCRGRI